MRAPCDAWLMSLTLSSQATFLSQTHTSWHTHTSTETAYPHFILTAQAAFLFSTHHLRYLCTLAPHQWSSPGTSAKTPSPLPPCVAGLLRMEQRGASRRKGKFLQLFASGAGAKLSFKGTQELILSAIQLFRLG